MTDMDSLLGETAAPAGRRRAQRNRRRGPGCLIALVILAVLGAGAYYAVSNGVDRIKDQFSSPDDYSGPGSGEVVFEVKPGDSISAMGRGLKDAGVVASVDAFISAASDNPGSNAIQAGFYPLQKQMKASDVVAVLVDPGNLVTNTVTIPEGLTIRQILARLAEGTDFEKAEFEQALKDTKALGLPAYANGNPEGYLFPATYSFGPKEQPADMLRDMVARWEQAAADNDLVNQAKALGHTPGEIMVIASLIEAEGRGDYRAKISRVIYNRLDNPDNGLTNGLLEIDATVNYALGRDDLGVTLTAEDLDVDSPYNTRKYPGLPPGPIEAPGDDSIQAALHPEDGPWLWYVTVNLKTGETKFTDSYDEFLQFKQEYVDYCETQSDRC